MKVVVDGAFLGGGRGGDETFMKGLLAGLALERAPEDCFPVVVTDPAAIPDAIVGDTAFPLIPVPSRPGPLHFSWTLPRAVRRVAGVDLVLSVTHAPLAERPPRILVIGDLSFVHRPGDYPVRTAKRLGVLVPRQVKQAVAILVPSEFTKQDVVSTYGTPEAKVHVVPNVVVPPASLQSAAAAGARDHLVAAGVRRPYLLYVGNIHPRKNVPLLIRSFRAARRAHPELDRYQLVIAGARWFGDGHVDGIAADTPTVRLLGRVPDAVRDLLIREAAALAYVSLFEGFGLPALEAMAVGTPVLASATTSLPWVCGDAAVLVDPESEAEVARGIARVLTDDTLRARLRRGGPEQAATFTVARTGRAAMLALRSACGRSAISRASAGGHDRCASNASDPTSPNQGIGTSGYGRSGA